MKRVISVVLVLAMMLAALPISLAAETDETATVAAPGETAPVTEPEETTPVTETEDPDEYDYLLRLIYRDLGGRGSLLNSGTKDNPVNARAAYELAAQYMKIRGFSLGKLYYSVAEGTTIDAAELNLAFDTVFPFAVVSALTVEDGVNCLEFTYKYPETDNAANVRKTIIQAYKVVKEELSLRYGMSYQDRLEAIHDYFVENVEYAEELDGKDGANPAYSAYGALVDGRAASRGISDAFSLCARLADIPIPAYTIDGTLENVPHTWNLIYLFGSLYHIDVAADSKLSDADQISHTHFMVSPGSTHKAELVLPWNTIWTMYNSKLSAGQLLFDLGLLYGSTLESGKAELELDLDGVTTRAQAGIMVVRMLGKDREAREQKYEHPFADASGDYAWVSDYVGYLHKNNLVEGVEPTRYDCGRRTSANDYMTFMFRVLGYSDKGETPDFTWAESVEFGVTKGLAKAGEYRSGGEIYRMDLALLGARALTLNAKDNERLLDKLVADGAVLAERATGNLPHLQRLLPQ